MLAAARLPVAAALCDAWENWLLFDIQAAFTLGDYSPAMANLPYPVAANCLLLAAHNVMIGAAATRLGRCWELFGTLAILAAIPSELAYITHAPYSSYQLPHGKNGASTFIT